MTTIANARIGRDHYKVTINAGKNVIIADEGENNGGKDEGFNPHQLLLASLGACTCATLRMYADRKQLNLEEVNVNLSLNAEEGKDSTTIVRQIELIGNLTPAERARLLEIANKCPIHKILSNPINITTSEIQP